MEPIADDVPTSLQDIFSADHTVNGRAPPTVFGRAANVASASDDRSKGKRKNDKTITTPPRVVPFQGAGEVRTNVIVLVTPCVPGGHTPLEHRDVLVVRHGSTPRSLEKNDAALVFRRFSATTLFWDGLTTRSIRLASLHTEMTLSVVPSQPSLNSRRCPPARGKKPNRGRWATRARPRGRAMRGSNPARDASHREDPAPSPVLDCRA